MAPAVLRFVTYMTPSLPLELYAFLAQAAGEFLGLETDLEVVETASGPSPEEVERGEDPFSRGWADVGFVCAPSYLWLHDRPDPRAELLGVAPVFRDPRNGGGPVYFSDVVVAAGSRWRSLEEMRGASWCYNDCQSLSGYFSVLERLTAMGEGSDFFRGGFCAGSHLAAIERVLDGTADAAAIDSNVLLFALRRRPGLAARLRTVASLGPHGVQPVVVRSGATAERRRDLRRLFDHLHIDPILRRTLAEDFLIAGFAPVSDADYDRERAILGKTSAPSGPD